VKEFYVSIDIETDGPIPGPHSMLSIGAAAIDPLRLSNQDPIVDTFEANLNLLPGAAPDPDTAQFWAENKAAYNRTRSNPIPPDEAMKRFASWVDKNARGLEAKPVAVAFPATFDFMFVYWYLIKFTGHSPFGFQAFDCKTAAAVILDIPFKMSSKRNFPRHWFKPGAKHSHVAVEDAIEQGYMFVEMMRQARQQKEG
jgi:hypothetical protein